MNTNSDGGKLNNDNVIARQRAAGPLVTCVAALLAISLGTAVGLIVPTGVPNAYATGVAVAPLPATL
jgi:hypothetical protein